MKRLPAAIALALAGCGVAFAHDDSVPREHTHWWLEMGETQWYAGASLGQSSFSGWGFVGDDGSFTTADRDSNDLAWRVMGGVDFGRYLGFELGYADFGEASYRAQSDGSGSFWAAGPIAEAAAIEAFDLTFRAKVPVTKATAVFAKVGVTQWEASYAISANTQSDGPVTEKQEEDERDPVFGLGAQYDGFRPTRMSVEYSVANLNNSSRSQLEFPHREVEVYSLTLAYLFE